MGGAISGLATFVLVYNAADSLYIFWLAGILFVLSHIVLPLIFKWRYPAGMILLFLLGAAISLIYVSEQSALLACPPPSYGGPLMSAAFPTPDNPCTGSAMPSRGVLLVYGSNGMIDPLSKQHMGLLVAVTKDPNAKEVVIQEDLVSIDDDGKGGGVINVKLYNDDGALIANIEKNVPIALGEDLCIKRPNLYTFIVQRHRLFRRPQVLLSLQYLNPPTFVLAGYFAYPGHGAVELTSDALIGPTGGQQRKTCLTSYGRVLLGF
jgi:hypothetical protein